MAKKIRLIARLDVKDEHLVKGIQYEGLRKLGAPHDFAVRYYEAGIDELLYLDTVASLYGRNNLSGILQRTSADVFIPVTAGGGVRSVQDVRALLRAGADKVAVNTAALKQPALITAIAQAFGRQCMVLSVQAKRRPGGGWEAYFDNGREHSGRDAVAWAAEGAQRGAGEILLTSVDAEGCRRGMDTELVAAVCAAVDVPVVARRAGWPAPKTPQRRPTRARPPWRRASALHYGTQTVQSLKQGLAALGWRCGHASDCGRLRAQQPAERVPRAGRPGRAAAAGPNARTGAPGRGAGAAGRGRLCRRHGRAVRKRPCRPACGKGARGHAAFGHLPWHADAV